MSQIQRIDELDQHAAWVTMWQEGVRATTAAMGLTQLSTARFIALSQRGAEILGTTVEAGIGLNYLDLVEPAQGAVESFRLAREGLIDGVRTRRRLRRVDGWRVEMHTTGWAIRSPAGPDLGLWAASEVQPAYDEAVSPDVVAPLFPNSSSSDRDAGRLVIDGRWRISGADLSDGLILGPRHRELIGSSFIELIHADDFPGLLFALARATTDPSAYAIVRLRQPKEQWQVTRISPNLSDDGQPKSGVVFDLAMDADVDMQDVHRVVADAPRHLRRIADQIEASGFLDSLVDTADTLGLATIPDLSPRQWEIFARLMRGQRVPAIAAELYLSASTIRNHLSSIFAKFGVHSQQELIELYRDQRHITDREQASSADAAEISVRTSATVNRRLPTILTAGRT